MPVFVGGIVRRIVEARRTGKAAESDAGVLAASGMIAGEGLAGVLIAFLIAAGTKWTGLRDALKPIHFAAKDFTYLTGAPAVILGVQRKYAKKNDFPEWCRLADRGMVGDAPEEVKLARMRSPFGHTTHLRTEFVEPPAEVLQRRLKRDMVVMQTPVTVHIRCDCAGYWAKIRAIEPVVHWVRDCFPGVHERAAEVAHSRIRFW